MKKALSILMAVALVATFSFFTASTTIAVTADQTTNVSGETLFENLDFGTYEIVVSKPGFYSKTTTATVVATESGKDAIVNVELVPITKGKVVIGDGIKDENGTPVYDADVTVNGGTDLDNLTEGTHTVVIEKDGYYTEEIEIEIVFIEGEEIYEIDITLRKITDGTATITVTNGLSPVNAVTVTINGTSIATDSEGKAVFNNLPVGTHEVSAYKDGFLTGTGSVTVIAKDGQNNPSATIALTEITNGSGSLKVIVKDSGGNPIGGASVRVKLND